VSSGAPRPSSGLFADPRPIEAIGDLFANVWQVSYVTPDLDRGMTELSELFGVENSTEVPVEGATFMKDGESVEWKPRVAMGARGGMIIELIEPVAGEVDFYRRFLPRNGGVLGFHHLATLVPLGDEPWAELGKLLSEHGMSFEYTILIPDRARLAYVDTTAQLGHYLELCQLEKADTDFFSGLIAESA
jgi:Glyoxalase/Bleomycin resistance protein/Dioxygenase superfamily